ISSWESTVWAISRSGAPLSPAPEHHVQRPAPPHVRPRPPAVFQDVSDVTPRGFQGVGQFRHAIEGMFIVDGLSKADHCGRELGWVEGHRAERVAEEVAEYRRQQALLGIRQYGILAQEVRNRAVNGWQGLPIRAGRRGLRLALVLFDYGKPF